MKKTLNILQVISFFFPAWAYGGPGKLVYELSMELEGLNHKLTIYSTDAYDRNNRRGNNESIPFHKEKFKIYFFKNISNYLAYTYKLFFPPNCINTIKGEIGKFDVIHMHEIFTFLTVVVGSYAIKRKVPYLLSAHGSLDSFHFSHRNFLKQVFMKVIGNKIIQNASMLVAATKEEVIEYELLGISKDKIAFIPNGINVHDYKSLPKRGMLRNNLNLTDKTKIVLYVGRISRLKGLDVLVKAFEKLTNQMDCRLIVIGNDDGYLEELQELVARLKIRNKVIFPGVVFGNEKLQAYVDADVFVYPSPSEGFSLAILEAAAAGLPLIITNGCKFKEIEKAGGGMVVESNETIIYNALLYILKNDKKRMKMGEKSQSFIFHNYSIEIMSKHMNTLYTSLAKNNG